MNSVPSFFIATLTLAISCTALAQSGEINFNPDPDNDGVFNRAGLGVDQAEHFNDALVLDAPFGDALENIDPTRYAQTFTSNVNGVIEAIRAPIGCTAGNLRLALWKLTGESPQDAASDKEKDFILLAAAEVPSLIGSEFNTYTLGTYDPDTDTTTGAYSTTVGERLAIVVESSGACLWRTHAAATRASYMRGDAFISTSNRPWSRISRELGTNNFDFGFSTLVRPELIDNCPEDKNITQINTDSDDYGDACDDDIDGDSVLNGSDKCPLIADDQTDSNNNDKGDACEAEDFCFPVIGDQGAAVVCL